MEIIYILIIIFIIILIIFLYRRENLKIDHEENNSNEKGDIKYSRIKFNSTGKNYASAEYILIKNNEICLYYKNTPPIDKNYNDVKHLKYLGFKWGWSFNQIKDSMIINDIIDKEGQFICTPSFSKSYIHYWESLIGLLYIHKEGKIINDVYICKQINSELECNKALIDILKYFLPNTKFHFNPENISFKKVILIGRTMIGDMSGWFSSKEDFKFFKYKVYEFYNIPVLISSIPKKPKVYIIQRKNGNPGRNIINLKTITDIVETFNCEIISPNRTFEEMSFNEQIEVTSNVDILIGGHGGGLTNGIFLRDNSATIEIYPWHFIDTGYSGLNIKCGNYYQSIQSKKPNNLSDPNKFIYFTSLSPWRNNVISKNLHVNIIDFEPVFLQAITYICYHKYNGELSLTPRSLISNN